MFMSNEKVVMLIFVQFSFSFFFCRKGGWFFTQSFNGK